MLCRTSGLQYWQTCWIANCLIALWSAPQLDFVGLAFCMPELDLVAWHSACQISKMIFASHRGRVFLLKTQSQIEVLSAVTV